MSETTMTTNGTPKTLESIVARLNASDRAAAEKLVAEDSGPIPTDDAVRAPASVKDTSAGKVAKISDVVQALMLAFPGRDEAIKAMALGMLAGEHVLTVGEPGTAKSALTRAFSKVTRRRYWEHLMNRFTSPDEILGPVKLTALQQDRFERAITGFLPTAEIVFLDEIFKANSAILNALLGALNERQVTEGANVIQIPLHTCVAASNEIPDPDDGLDALYDRFLVRVRVKALPDGSDFERMLVSGGDVTNVPQADLAAEHAAVRKVSVTHDTITAISSLRRELRKDGITMSDRRWRQSIRILRAHAHLDGRTSVDPETDLSALMFVIPNKDADVKIVEATIAKSVNPVGAKCHERVTAAKDAIKRMAKIDPSTDPGTALTTIGGTVREVTAILADLATFPQGKARTKAEADIGAMVAKLKEQATDVARRAAGV